MIRTFVIFLLTFCGTANGSDFRVGPIPDSLRISHSLDGFYQKQCAGSDVPIVGSAKVSDHAFAEAAWIVRQMLAGRDDIKKAMNESKVRVVIMAATEYTSDVPEHSFLKTKMFWDRRARGLGATPTVPAVSCGEENLLGYLRDPYPNENIFVHEFAHAIHGTGMNRVDKTFDGRLKVSFEAAKARGLWKNAYAATNAHEYWAEGVQCWFDDNAPPDALHNHIRTRVQLMEYDAGLAKLCKEVFGEKPWRYLRPALRSPADRSHLIGYDPKKMPRFRWKEYPLIDKPIVSVDTSVGEMTFELDTKAASEATQNFLKIALDGAYHSGRFKSAFTDAGDKKTGWIGATAKPKWVEEYSKELKLDLLPAKPAAPTDGTIALVRSGEVGEFVIFLGKQPAGNANVVPFGKVTKGMELVRKIHAGPTVNGVLKEAVDLRRAIRSE